MYNGALKIQIFSAFQLLTAASSSNQLMNLKMKVVNQPLKVKLLRLMLIALVRNG